MFFADELSSTDGRTLASSSKSKQSFESTFDVSVADRYRNAPDEDSDDGIAIVVPPRSSTQPLGNATAGLDAKSRVAAASVGEELLKGMVRAAKKEGREDAAKAMRAANQEALPKFVGGFAGAGGTAHASFELLPGMVVCLTNQSGATTSNLDTGTSDGFRTPRQLTWKKESEISPEEVAFGHRVTDATVASIFAVVRVTQKECEVQLADGERKVVPRSTIRPATKPEEELFARWTRDPRTLPPEAARRKRNREEAGGTAPGVSIRGSSAGCREQRWVQKNLLVRCVSSAVHHAENLGKKFVVQSVGTMSVASTSSTKGGTTRITVMATPLLEDATLSTSSGGLVQFFQRDLETVLPKIGEKGIILAGPQSGSVAVVRGRVRDKESGEVTDVTVAIAPETITAHTDSVVPSCHSEAPNAQQQHPLDDILVTLSPNDFCAFLLQPGET